MANAVKNIFNEFDRMELYESMSKCDLKWFHDKMLEKYADVWKVEIAAKPKLRTYVKLKDTYGVENYVQLNLSKSQRSLLAQIRLGILPLYIETGRYTRTKAEDRICTLCKSHKVENELHFLFQCKLYKEERTNFLKSLSGLNYSLADNFRYICNTFPRKLAKYISVIWMKRKETMYKM